MINYFEFLKDLPQKEPARNEEEIKITKADILYVHQI